MSTGRLFIGIDTSCYTTSVAAMPDGQKAIGFKKMLDVKEGGCGLRQSDAFFQHIKNLPELTAELRKRIDFRAFDEICVSVSSRPRSVEGSYMPVFLAGRSVAAVMADSLGAELCEVSHQEGHIMAAIYSCRKYSILSEPFLTFHLSGGTSELLLARPHERGFDCEIVGGTRDLPAGQFIDRIGVEMGMPFPCGKYLDYSAMEYDGEKPKVKTCVGDCYINFSGEETRYRRLLADGADRGRVAYSVMKCISESVKAAVVEAREKYGVENVLMVGGVSSSAFLKSCFGSLEKVYFAEPELSCDNAVGVCELGRLLYGGKNGESRGINVGHTL